MQPLTQHIFTQIIAFYFYLSKRFSDFSCKNLLQKPEQTFFFFVNLVFGQKFTRNAKKLSGHAVSQLWQILTLNLCGYWSRVGSRVKKVIIFNLVISVVPYSYPILWIHEANLYKHAKSLHEIIKLYLPRSSFVYMHHRASFTVFARKAVPKDLYQV